MKHVPSFAIIDRYVPLRILLRQGSAPLVERDANVHDAHDVFSCETDPQSCRVSGVRQCMDALLPETFERGGVPGARYVFGRALEDLTVEALLHPQSYEVRVRDPFGRNCACAGFVYHDRRRIDGTLDLSRVSASIADRTLELLLPRIAPQRS